MPSAKPPISIKGLFSRNRELLTFALLNYGDKLLTFLIPLSALYLVPGVSVYNEVEYIYALAALVMVLVEGGGITYYLYAYKEATDKEALVSRVRRALSVQFIICALLGLGASLFLATFMPDAMLLGSLLIVRSLFSLLLWYLAMHFRILDKPSRVFAATYAVNILTLASVLYAGSQLHELPLPLFFGAQALCVVVGFLAALKSFQTLSLRDCIDYLRESFAYSWPVTLTVLLFMGMAQAGKIYARNALSADEMFELSFLQRLTMIIWLAHSSAIGYLSKGIFVDSASFVRRRHIATYAGMIFGGCLLTFAAAYVLGWLDVKRASLATLPGLFLVIYTLLWCGGSFLELYMNKLNKNRLVLLFALSGALVYSALMLFAGFPPLVTITSAMCAGLTINVLLLMIYLHRELRRFRGALQADIVREVPLA